MTHLPTLTGNVFSLNSPAQGGLHPWAGFYVSATGEPCGFFVVATGGVRGKKEGTYVYSITSQKH